MALKDPRLVLWPVTWTAVFLGNKREWRRNLTASVGDSYQCVHGCSVQSSAALTGLLPLLLWLGQRGSWHKHGSLLSFFFFFFFSWLAGGSFLSSCDNTLQQMLFLHMLALSHAIKLLLRYVQQGENVYARVVTLVQCRRPLVVLHIINSSGGRRSSLCRKCAYHTFSNS